MKKNSSKTFFAATVIGLLLVATCTQVLAEDDGKEIKPLALRKIMQDLGESMQTVTDGISREDWQLVLSEAPLIANYPQPPLTEKVRLLRFAGSNVARFKGHDKRTREAAQQLESAAASGDGLSVIASFATLQKSCLACHQDFRKEFVQHFYGDQ